MGRKGDVAHMLTKRLAIASLAIFFSITTYNFARVQETQERPTGLFLTFQKGKVGYIDRTGKYIWKPTR